MDKGWIPVETIDTLSDSFPMNAKGQTYGEYMNEKRMIRGSAKLRDAVLKYLKERVQK